MKNLLLLSLTFITSIIFAQTGPGGIGNSSSNILWLNADDILLNDSSLVDQWPDISGNNNHAFQNSTTNQPILLVNKENSHNVVAFDGANDYLSLTNHITTDDMAMYIVFNNHLPFVNTRYGVTIENHSFVTKLNGTQWHLKSGFWYGSRLNQSRDEVNEKLEMVSGQTIGSSTNILTSKRGDDRYFTNRQALNNNSESLIGAYYNGSNYTNFHDGNIAEVVIFNDTLNPVERRILMNSLTAKYGSNMYSFSIDHFAYQNTHSNNVIGIGSLNGFTHTTSRGQGLIEISNPDDLVSNEFFFTGDNNAPLTTNTSDVPQGFNERLERVWRGDHTGNVGTMNLKFYVDANTLPNISDAYVLIDNDGNFSNGGTSQHDFGRTVDATQGFISFNDVNIPDGYYYTLATYDPSNYIVSVTSGDWNNPLTWNCNCVPDVTNQVRIVDTDAVTLTDNRSITALTIEANASFTLNPSTIFSIYDTLTVYGQMNNNENLVITSGTEEVEFYNYSGDTLVFYSLEVNSDNGLNLINGLWATEHTLRVKKDRLTNNGTLTFLSDATKTAQILPSVSNSFDGGGEYIMERYISPRKAAYANLASPTTTNLSDWDQEIYMSGVGGIDGNAQYGPTGPIYYSVYGYNNLNHTYDTITSVSETLIPGTGYELFLGDDLFNYTPVELGTINVHGVPTSGSVSRPVTPGFNLLGNPYQAFISLSSVTKPSGVQNYYYVFNANSGNYQIYTFTSIPPSQAFWIEVPSGVSGNVTFSETSKVLNNNSNTSTFLRTKYNPSDSIKLTVHNDVNDFWHEHIVELNALSNKGEDERDLGYLPSRARGVPALYSTIESEAYANGGKRDLMVNSVNSNEESHIVDLTFRAGTDANYTINYSDINVSNTYSCILLEDKKENTIVDLNKLDSYTFYSKEGNFNRFTLHLNKKIEECETDMQKSENGLSIEKLNGEYFLIYNLKENSDHVSIRIIDALGRQIKETHSQDIKSSGQIKINTNDLNGIYLINVESQSGRNVSNKFYF